MFDMRSIGKEIAKLRKEKNMTQVELADQLNISYQAVSNWERGDSMPDISKLTDLSSILGISIDDLLGNGKEAKAVKEVIETNKVDIENNDQETLASVLPLMKPKQVDESTKEKIHLPFDKIITLAPFLDEETIDELVGEAIKSEHRVDVIALAPFMSEEGLKKLVYQELDKSDIDSSWIIAVAPFLDEETIDDLAHQAVENNKDLKINALLPFMSEDGVSKLVTRLYNQHSDGDIKWLVSIAPFMGKDALSLICFQHYLKHGTKGIVAVAPFISEEVIEKMINEEIEKGNYKEIMGLMPFSSKNMEEFIIKEMRAHFKKT